jgi:hypothetical protein
MWRGVLRVTEYGSRTSSHAERQYCVGSIGSGHIHSHVIDHRTEAADAANTYYNKRVHQKQFLVGNAVGRIARDAIKAVHQSGNNFTKALAQ